MAKGFFDNLEQVYDPNIQSILSTRKKAWGNPLENRKNLVPYGQGFKEFDKALYGINTMTGEFLQTIGERKMRKTTLWINIITNIMDGPKPKKKPPVSWHTLESSMPPDRLTDQFISNLATRILFEQGHVFGTYCPVCDKPECQHMGLSPEFLMFNSRTKEQVRAIDEAMSRMDKWPLLIYGPAENEGDTRNLKEAIELIRKDIEDSGIKITVVDHQQQYFANTTSDYEKQALVIGKLGDIVAQKKAVVSLLSQVSLTSVRE
jgi:hypothetical protein